jgi:hypothetical protein
MKTIDYQNESDIKDLLVEAAKPIAGYRTVMVVHPDAMYDEIHTFEDAERLGLYPHNIRLSRTLPAINAFEVGTELISTDD